VDGKLAEKGLVVVLFLMALATLVIVALDGRLP
jgi:hypothetical protein